MDSFSEGVTPLMNFIARKGLKLYPRGYLESKNFVLVTQYGSTVYIGIAMVFLFSPYIRKFSSYFQFQLLMTLQHRT